MKMVFLGRFLERKDKNWNYIENFVSQC